MAVTITNADIVSRLKLLSDYHAKADSGSTTTAICSALQDEPNFTHNYICFISGDNAGTDRVITDFTNGIFTFDALDNTVDNTTEFCLVKNGFASDVLQATSIVKNDFRNKGYDVTLFLNDATQLKELHIYKTIELICGGLLNDGTDTDAYFVQKERFKELYNTEMNSLIADYDLNEDGNIDDDEESFVVGQVGFTR